MAEYQQTLQAFQREEKVYLQSAQSEVKSLEAAYQTRFEQGRADVIQKVSADIVEVRHGHEAVVERFVTQFPYLLDALDLQLRLECEAALRSVRRSLMWFLFPTEADCVRELLIEWFAGARTTVAATKTEYEGISDRRPEILLAAIRKFLNQYDVQLSALEQDLQEISDSLRESKAAIEVVRQQAKSETLLLRDNIIRELSERIEVVHDGFRSFVESWTTRIMTGREALKKEAEAAGL